MSNIRETVQSSLSAAGYGQYTSYAGSTISALEARESDIASRIIEAGVEAEIDRETLHSLLTSLGMTVPVTAPVAEAGTPGDSTQQVLNALLDMQRQVSALMQAARDNGITVRV